MTTLRQYNVLVYPLKDYAIFLVHSSRLKAITNPHRRPQYQMLAIPTHVSTSRDLPFCWCFGRNREPWIMIETPFEGHTRLRPRNPVLHGVHIGDTWRIQWIDHCGGCGDAVCRYNYCSSLFRVWCRGRKVLENRNINDEERISQLEKELEETILLGEESDRKFEEVSVCQNSV